MRRVPRAFLREASKSPVRFRLFSTQSGKKPVPVLFVESSLVDVEDLARFMSLIHEDPKLYEKVATWNEQGKDLLRLYPEMFGTGAKFEAAKCAVVEGLRETHPPLSAFLEYLRTHRPPDPQTLLSSFAQGSFPTEVQLEQQRVKIEVRSLEIAPKKIEGELVFHEPAPIKKVLPPKGKWAISYDDEEFGQTLREMEALNALNARGGFRPTN